MTTIYPKTDKGWQAYLTNVRAPEHRQWLPMGDGLTVCLEPSGAKTFQARLRRQQEINPRRIRIGAFPALSVGAARRKLLELKALAREGKDPSLEERRRRAGITGPRTLDDLVDEYLRRRQGQVAQKTEKIDRDLLKGVLCPALGVRLLTDLSPADFGKVVSDYADSLRRNGRSGGTNANKLLAASRRLFKQARGWGLYDREDPTRGLTKPAKEVPRDRILWDGRILVGPDPKANELGQLVSALLADTPDIPVSYPTRVAILLTVIMGFRASEVASLEWASIALDGDTPTVGITKSKTKAGMRTLPLPSFAQSLLQQLRSGSSPRKYVFPAEEGSKRAPHLHSESISRAFSRACQRLGISAATLHDLRRTCLSGLIELGHDGLAERIAGHSPKHVIGRHYDRSSRLKGMMLALSDWAEAVQDAAQRAGHGRDG